MIEEGAPVKAAEREHLRGAGVERGEQGNETLKLTVLLIARIIAGYRAAGDEGAESLGSGIAVKIHGGGCRPHEGAWAEKCGADGEDAKKKDSRRAKYDPNNGHSKNSIRVNQEDVFCKEYATLRW
jgi:hypothetical protein